MKSNGGCFCCCFLFFFFAKAENLCAFSVRLTHIIVHNPPRYKAKKQPLFIKQLIMSKLGENSGRASVCFCDGHD